MFLTESIKDNQEEVVASIEESTIALLEANIAFAESYSNIRHAAVLLEFRALNEADEGEKAKTKAEAVKGYFVKAWEIISAFFKKMYDAIVAMAKNVSVKAAAAWEQLFKAYDGDKTVEIETTVPAELAMIKDVIAKITKAKDAKALAVVRQDAAKAKEAIKAEKVETTVNVLKAEKAEVIAMFNALVADAKEIEAVIKTGEAEGKKLAEAEEKDEAAIAANKKLVDEARFDLEKLATKLGYAKSAVVSYTSYVKQAVRASGGTIPAGIENAFRS